MAIRRYWPKVKKNPSGLFLTVVTWAIRAARDLILNIAGACFSCSSESP